MPGNAAAEVHGVAVHRHRAIHTLCTDRDIEDTPPDYQTVLEREKMEKEELPTYQEAVAKQF